MPRKNKKTFDEIANVLGKELAEKVTKLKGSACRERQEDLLEAIAEKAIEYLPEAPHDELVDTFYDTLVNGLHSALIDATNEAKRMGSYNHDVMVEAFDKLNNDIESWTDE